MTPEEKELFVAWRRGDGRIIPVGRLRAIGSGPDREYEFGYIQQALGDPEFRPLPGFPDLDRTYRSHRLFSLFSNRLMSRKRADYPDYIGQLHLDDDSDPFVVLGRSGGRKLTDRVEVFRRPEANRAGELESIFFARGLRYRECELETALTLRQGDMLGLVLEPENAYNPRARRLITVGDRPVGYLPDYLVQVVDDLEAHGSLPEVHVEHVNPTGTAPNLLLLCRLTAPWPLGYAPFSGSEYQPIVIEERTAAVV